MLAQNQKITQTIYTKTFSTSNPNVHKIQNPKSKPKPKPKPRPRPNPSLTSQPNHSSTHPHNNPNSPNGKVLL